MELLPPVAIGIFQLPGSNELKTAALVKSKIAEMAKSFPPGMKYSIPYDPTLFTQQSIDAVYETLRDATILVVVVVMVFLQNMPGVELTFAVEGLSILDSTTKSNALTVFFPLKPFSERIGHPEQSATAIVAKLRPHFPRSRMLS